MQNTKLVPSKCIVALSILVFIIILFVASILNHPTYMFADIIVSLGCIETFTMLHAPKVLQYPGYPGKRNVTTRYIVEPNMAKD